LFRAGNQVPEIPLLEVVGSAVSASSLQISATASNVGVSFVSTVMVRVPFSAHCPAVGVNVYVVVVELFKAGDHVPLIPLLETRGKAL
jgi:hypothetical protein